MLFLDMILDDRLVFALGIINVLTIMLVFFSCRCLIGRRFVDRMWKYKWYRIYHKGHCYYWWLLAVSVLLHSTIALSIYGDPF